MKNFRFLCILILTSLMVLFSMGGASAAAGTFTETNKIPLNMGVFVSCAAGGAGELVSLSGDLLILSHLTVDSAGGVLYESVFNPQGVSGIGQTSGDKYQGTGVTRTTEYFGRLPFQYTTVNNFRIIGQGTGNNFSIHENFHVTVNANGEVTATVDNFSADCK